MLTKLIISRLDVTRDTILAGRKLGSGRFNSGVETVGHGTGAIEEVSHTVNQPLLQSVVLLAQLRGNPLAHGSSFDVLGLFKVLLDRQVRDEPLLGQMTDELIMGDREGARHRCALTK